jgi:hypothetical protein
MWPCFGLTTVRDNIVKFYSDVIWEGMEFDNDTHLDGIVERRTEEK